MNEQYVKGAADKVAGKIKEFAGRVTGNKKLETKGKVDQVKGLYIMQSPMPGTPAKKPLTG